MTNNTVKALKEYYTSYYNRNFLRDYRYIFNDKKEHKYNDVLQENSYKKWDNSEKKALTFLTTKRHKGHAGSLFNTLSYYKSLTDYHKGNINLRFSDRLFFDFDIEDAKVTNIKHLMSDVYKSDDDAEVKMDNVSQLQEKFRDLLFNDDLLYSVFVEASRLCDYLESIDLKPFLIFSGSKGFHINLFFEEMQLNQMSNISYHLYKIYKDKLNLRYLDSAVNVDAIGRSQRVQYAYHSNTNLLTQPIDRKLVYDDVLDVIEKNKRKPIKFDIKEYIAPTRFTEYLQNLNTKFNIKTKLDNMSNNVKQQIREEKRKNLKFTDYKDVKIDIDMRELTRHYGIDGKANGDKIRIKCPFHNDNNPSAVVNEKGIYCSACARSFNYYDLIAEMENLSDKSEIMKIARKLSK